MMRRLRRARADAGAGGQWVVHPAQANFCDFHPAIADRRLAALFEGLATTLRIEQGKLARGGLRVNSDQRKDMGSAS